jgi:hypothetical protein
MANVEGAVRMRKAGKIFILGGMGAMLLAGGLMLSSIWLPHGSAVVMMPSALLVYFGIMPEIAGVVLWVMGWIVEGFLLPDELE